MDSISGRFWKKDEDVAAALSAKEEHDASLDSEEYMEAMRAQNLCASGLRALDACDAVWSCDLKGEAVRCGCVRRWSVSVCQPTNDTLVNFFDSSRRY